MNLTQSQIIILNPGNGRQPKAYLVMKGFNLKAMFSEFRVKYHGVIPEQDAFLSRMMSRGYLRKYHEEKLVVLDGLPT